MTDLNKLQQRKNRLVEQLKKLEEREKKTTIKLILQSLKGEQKEMDTEFILSWIKASENIRKMQWDKWQNNHDEKELKNDMNYLYNKLLNK